jgi:hypothetical protein
MNRVPAFDYRVVEQFLSSLNSPRALTVFILFKYSEFGQIVNLGFLPDDYNSIEDARLALLATDLLRKHENLPTSIDRKEVAFSSFEKSEEQCRLTNERLLGDNPHAAQMFCAQRKIVEVLGHFDAEEMFELGGWGPGSTLNIRRVRASISNKFRKNSELTPALFKVLSHCFGAYFPTWQPKYEIVTKNKVITVPKNAKTDRTIGVEPSLNLYFQKGVGTMIRRRLARFGVDLNDQTYNQRLALQGSLTNRLATVDFSAASDTISYQCVLDLLPFNWFKVLDLLRSPSGDIKGRGSIVYQKFSSMGNGFTFELESLIFWALAKAVVPKDHPYYDSINVFGDDVIIPSEFMEQYRSLCAFCGFTINAAKSFSNSPYRESCGKHYWDGIDITPIYLRRSLSKTESMRFHNRVVELSRRSIGRGFRDMRFRGCINLLWNSRHSELAMVVCPVGYGDLGYIRDFDEVCPRFNRTLQRGWFSKCYLESSKSVEEDDEALLKARLYSLWKQGDTVSDVALGNKVTYSLHRTHKVKTLWFPDWPSLGSWI